MTHECIARLMALGIDQSDATALRRIAMTLHHWHERECGDSNAWGSWVIVRGSKHNGTFTHDDNGKPYLETHTHNVSGARYSPIPDRERGAHRRLAAIMGRYPTLRAYVQTDPRGAALYVLRSADIPAGASIDSCYNRGIAVYK